ncbi:MAG TPA: polysaccharide biosynthesis protein [Halanaerobiaceae bacterium]|nr:polysaccharide biosynthesis protein [Halanaerobiaceae bacterium]
MRKQSFLQGALILMIAGLINRILGFILRIIIVRILGDEGLGLFQRIFPLFMTLLLLSTSGFPVAIAKLIPEKMAKKDLQGTYNLLKLSLFFVLSTSTLIIALILPGARFISTVIYKDSRTLLLILAILPALLFSSLSSCFNAYFQGLRNMLPTALAQTTEQASRFIATLVFLILSAPHDVHYRSAGIALGISVGEMAAFLLLVILFIQSLFKNYQPGREKDYQRIRPDYRQDFKEITGLALPITAGRIVHSLMMNAEAILIPRQLQLKGFSLTEATSLYGQLSGMAEQLVYLPTVITIALTTSLVPTIAHAYARKNFKKIKSNYQDVIRICSYLGFPLAVIFFRLGPDLTELLFAHPQAGSLLAILAFSCPFLYYQQVSNGMLNGLGKPQLSFINMAIGSGVKLLGILVLTGPFPGISGPAISISLGIILSALLNFISIGDNIGYSICIKNCFLKPLLASSIIFFALPLLKAFLALLNIHYKISLILLLIISLSLYIIIMFGLKAITPEDLHRFRS